MFLDWFRKRTKEKITPSEESTSEAKRDSAPIACTSAPDSYVQGTVFFHGSKEELAEILIAGGFTLTIGHWVVRLNDCGRYFELAYVGNISPDKPFEVEGDGYGVPVAYLSQCCERIAQCLEANEIGFDFFHLTTEGDLIHHYRPST